MLNDTEKEELKFYKSRLVASVCLYLLITCFIILFSFLFKQEIRNPIIKIVMFNLLIVSLIEGFLFLSDERAYSKIFNLFNGVYMFTLLPFACAVLILNEEILNWSLLSNIILFSVIFFTFISITLYGLHLKDSIDQAIQEGKLDPEDYIYNFFKKGYVNDIRKKGLNMGFKGYSFSMLITGLGCLIIYSLGYKVDMMNIKQIIRGMICLVVADLSIGYSALFFIKAIQILKYEKKINRPIYTGLVKYIRREDEINAWRKSRNLKSVRIKSPFFFGDIEK